MKLTVAGYQMSVTENINTNTNKICDAVNRAAEEKADILLTPEGSLSGYTHDFDFKTADEALAHVENRAKEKGIGLALGTCFKESDGSTYNQIRFYKPDGRFLGFHSKTLLCGSMDTPPEGEINHFAHSDLKVFLWNKDLTIGGLICNDMWANPGCSPIPDIHLSQELSRMGAQIIFHAVNGGRHGNEWSDVTWNFHESNLRMRARAGGLWIVTADNSNPIDMRCSSPSGVINPQGEWEFRTKDKGEELFIFSIELEK
jgi:predicted amidohydrolase